MTDFVLAQGPTTPPPTPSPTSTPTPAPTPGSGPPLVLPDNSTIVLLIVAGVVLLGIGAIIIWGRSGTTGDKVIVRSWLAVSFTAGLLLFCAASLALGDTTLRSTLFGGLVASVGASSAFYFASRGSDQARKDILNASTLSVPVPDLSGRTVAEANIQMAKLPLVLMVSPSDAEPDWIIQADQQPRATTSVPHGSAVEATAKKA
jgi:hypothetical protein